MSSAQSTALITRGDFVNAVAELEIAITALRKLEPDSLALPDALRLDLIVCLALSEQPERARAGADALIAEVQSRDGDSALIVALARLAMARAMGEDHDGMEALLLQAQPVIVERLGENHSRHLQLLGELLSVTFRRSDWAQATVYAQRLHERVRAKFGDAHALTYVTLGNWGRTLAEAGDAQAAAVHLREALARLREIAGPDAPQTHDVAFVLAAVELELGHGDAAEPLIESLDSDILEAGRANGLWAFSIDVLRGLLMRQRGEDVAARALLDQVGGGARRAESTLYACDRGTRPTAPDQVARERTPGRCPTRSAGGTDVHTPIPAKDPSRQRQRKSNSSRRIRAAGTPQACNLARVACSRPGGPQKSIST